jgi:hypothetical protein
VGAVGRTTAGQCTRPVSVALNAHAEPGAEENTIFDICKLRADDVLIVAFVFIVGMKKFRCCRVVCDLAQG